MQDIAKITIERAAAGDMAAFEEIYKVFSPAVYSVALGITRNRQDAEEAAQEVFMKIYRGLKNFNFNSSLWTWTYRIAVNAAINVYKSRVRRGAAMENIEDAGDIPDAVSAGQRDALIQKESESKLLEVLKGLSAEHRACIVLREIEGLDYKEMADALGIPLNTVRTRLMRAREALIAMSSKRRDLS